MIFLCLRTCHFKMHSSDYSEQQEIAVILTIRYQLHSSFSMKIYVFLKIWFFYVYVLVINQKWVYLSLPYVVPGEVHTHVDPLSESYMPRRREIAYARRRENTHSVQGSLQRHWKLSLRAKFHIAFLADRSASGLRVL